MNIENSMLARGGQALSDRILSFLNTIVVKNTQEADLTETETSYNYYTLYQKCIHGTTIFEDHSYSETDSNFPSNLVGKTLQQLNLLVKAGDITATTYINILRKKFIDGYVDKNSYFTMLTGKPFDQNSVVKIVDRDNSAFETIDVTNIVVEKDGYEGTQHVFLSDISLINFPNAFRYLTYSVITSIAPTAIVNVINVEDVTYINNPKTYTALFVNGYINDIISIYGYTNPYVIYVGKNLDVQNIRDASQFEILWVDRSILDDTELENFFEAYESVKEFIMNTKYVESFESAYDNYSQAVFMTIILGCYQRMCNLYIDRYSVRNFTDQEIYDILDSNNLTQLKSVNIKILRNVVENIDTLVAHRGTEKILKMIVETVIQDQTLSIRRYNLVKKFKTNDNGITKIDYTKSYDDPSNVDLAFVDETLYSPSKNIKTVKSASQIIDYEDFVLQDPTWAANGMYDSDADKLKAIRAVKKKILKIKFNRLNTKYLGVTSVLEVFSINSRIQNKVGLLMQYYGGFRPLNSLKISYNDISSSPLDLYNFIYFGYRVIDYILRNDQTYDTITRACCTYELMMRYNVLSLNDTLQVLRNLTIEPQDIKSKIQVKHILDDSDIIPFIYTFNTSMNSFNSIMDQFDLNYVIFNKLGDKSMMSGDYHEVLAWKAIYNWFNITVDSYTDYQSVANNSFTNYFEINNPLLFNLLITIRNSCDNLKSEIVAIENDVTLTPDVKAHAIEVINNQITTNVLNIETLCRNAGTAFKSELDPVIHEDNSSDVSNSIKNSEDLSRLVTTFASIYVELRDIDIDLDMSDDPNNVYQIMDGHSDEYISSIRDRFGVEYDYSTEEYQVNKELFIIGDFAMSEENNQIVDIFSISDSYIIDHLDTVRTRFDLVDIYGEEFEDNGDDTFGIVDNYTITDYKP